MDGIINVYKEAGFTSHDVVAVLRGVLKTRKIGHTGTLDPDAVGVLPVCIGKATKVCDLLTDKDKEYIAKVKLGIQTDTLDMSGKILNEDKNVNFNNVNFTPEEIGNKVSSFLGEISQIPPMYSAIKINGKKLYEYAREGKEIERKARKVNISEISAYNFNYEDNTFDLKVGCSKGTYIRSLCEDIGKALNTYAAMESLIRTRSGDFDIEKSLKLGEIKEIAAGGRLDEILIPIDYIFKKYPRVFIDEEYDKVLLNGNKFEAGFIEGLLKEGLSAKSPEEKAKEDFSAKSPEGKAKEDFSAESPEDKDGFAAKKVYTDSGLVRMYNSTGFKAIYEKVDGFYKPRKMFL
ncbi:MAG: tRNA pseudouridine(55) synthase TruB [Lachnospiraceae bacterium]|nr:tRNA pseudouridine(55) synthase TruB [Lachnospiraceae bacterium]